MVTIKEVAERAGVSRGTVDRVINQRDGVNEETRQKVLKVLKSMKYEPNAAGKNLSVRKKNLKFGFMYFGKAQYMKNILPFVKERTKKLEELGITVIPCDCETDNAPLFVNNIDRLLALGIHGLVTFTFRNPIISAKLREVGNKGIPVVTQVVDLGDSGRIAFVGNDYYTLGRVSGNLMELMCPNQGTIGVMSNFEHVHHHDLRIYGFKSRLAERRPELKVLPTIYGKSDNAEGYELMKGLLAKEKELRGMYLESSAMEGACQAIQESGRKIGVVTLDDTEKMRAYLKEGIVSALIQHDNRFLANKPFDLLYDKLVYGKKPEEGIYYAPFHILISENL